MLSRLATMWFEIHEPSTVQNIEPDGLVATSGVLRMHRQKVYVRSMVVVCVVPKPGVRIQRCIPPHTASGMAEANGVWTVVAGLGYLDIVHFIVKWAEVARTVISLPRRKNPRLLPPKSQKK